MNSSKARSKGSNLDSRCSTKDQTNPASVLKGNITNQLQSALG